MSVFSRVLTVRILFLCDLVQDLTDEKYYRDSEFITGHLEKIQEKPYCCGSSESIHNDNNNINGMFRAV